MCRRGVIIGLALLLAACEVNGDPFANFPTFSLSTGSSLGFSDRVKALIDMGRNAATQARETAEDIRGRVGKVQSGVHLMLEGKELIQEAVR